MTDVTSRPDYDSAMQLFAHAPPNYYAGIDGVRAWREQRIAVMLLLSLFLISCWQLYSELGTDEFPTQCLEMVVIMFSMYLSRRPLRQLLVGTGATLS